MLNHISFDIAPILVSSIVCFSIVAFWFSPALFGVKWKSLIGNPELKNITVRSYILIFLVIIIFNIVMSLAIDITNSVGMSNGVIAGVLIWIGFCCSTMAIQFLFEQRSKFLFLITSGYLLVICVISAALHAMWK